MYKITIQSLLDSGHDVRGVRVSGSDVCGVIRDVNSVGGVYLRGKSVVYDARHLTVVPRKVLNVR
jgi:hypothetical protein